MPEPGTPGGPVAWPPQYLEDQLTLLQPGRADYPHPQIFSPAGITEYDIIILIEKQILRIWLQKQKQKIKNQNVVQEKNLNIFLIY